MKKIGIDLDNTVADYIKGMAPELKNLYGLEPDFSKNAYSIEEVFGIDSTTRPPGMRQKLYIERRAFRKLPKLENDNHLLTQQLRDAVDLLKIYFVTARSPHPVIIEDTRMWVEENTATYDDIFHVDSKATFCKMAGIQVMIEDEVRQILPLVQKGVHVVVMDQPWNRNIPADPHGLEDHKGRIIRASNWAEAFEAARSFLSPEEY